MVLRVFLQVDQGGGRNKYLYGPTPYLTHVSTNTVCTAMTPSILALEPGQEKNLKEAPDEQFLSLGRADMQ